jgi:mRNA-degrading endonuclease RelE of RelBE toxin-antitoxin system
MQRILKKLAKKDPIAHEALENKILEIIENPGRYKPLGNVMAGKRRVHLGSFVLVFSIDEARQAVVFEDYDHHDRVYRPD